MVSFEWYRSFMEVYRVGTVSGAAQVLHLTQPAVSQHIAALESALGVPLFQRMPRRMLSTEAGKRLYTRIASAMETLESVSVSADLANTPLLIRLGTPQEFFTEQVIQRLKTRDTLFSIQFGLAQELIEQLLNNQLDCVIATQKLAKSELEYQLIFEENFWLVGPPESEIPISQNLLPVDLSLLAAWLIQQPWIAYSDELPIIRRFWRIVFGWRLDVSPQFVIPDLRSIRTAIAHGLGYSILPDYLCREWIAAGKLKLVLKPTKAVTNQIWLAYRKSERQSQKTTMLFNLLSSESF
ncbi:MAG: LysR family transcriptional regulator [Trichormus sp. ATA11-4-KO1]|jgi:DNA-binding transcriptional LysR family regulator|nr:LysR family transcriptional regulator [Trichormus sp. ATA11-4-KO1]